MDAINQIRIYKQMDWPVCFFSLLYSPDGTNCFCYIFINLKNSEEENYKISLVPFGIHLPR